MEKDLLKIIEHYGVMPQLKYFQSEIFELNEAIIKHENKNLITLVLDSLNKSCCALNGKEYKVQSIEHIAEEIADCYVMLEQFKFYYNIEDIEIAKIMKNKINRTLERIESGYYEK